MDETLRAGLESVMSAAEVKYQRDERQTPEHTITYIVEAREDLKLSIELLADQLNVYFNGCVLLLEYAAHVPKFGRNTDALAYWRSECLEVVRSILSSDLRISIRSWGSKVLGGYLWRRNGDSWVCVGGGGSPLMFLGRHRTMEYCNWLARQAQPVDVPG